MIDTSSVSSRNAVRTASAGTRPHSSGSIQVTSAPCRSSSLNVSSTDLCSVRALTKCGCLRAAAGKASAMRRAAEATPWMARLLASVAPEVKMIWRARVPMSRATAMRPISTTWLAECPAPCVAEAALPCNVGALSTATMASATPGSTGVVAA